MAPLPIIAGVYRVVLNWSVGGGIRPVNVFHVQALTGDVDDVGERIEAEFTQGLINPTSSAFEVVGTTITPLDGSTASRVRTWDDPIQGATSVDFSPASAAVLSMHTDIRGARGRGRLYLGPVGENSINQGLYSSDTSFVVDAWDTFQAALNGGSPSMEVAVASYAHSDANLVTSFAMSRILGTQRRRQDQLR